MTDNFIFFHFSSPSLVDYSFLFFLLRADGDIHVALSDETPFAINIDMKSQDQQIVLPLDYNATGAPELGRQASTSDIKTALFEPEEERPVTNERVVGLLTSTPKKKSRASSGGSGKISMIADVDLMEMLKDKNHQGYLTAMAEGKIHISIHGWMDRIRNKYLVDR